MNDKETKEKLEDFKEELDLIENQLDKQLEINELVVKRLDIIDEHIKTLDKAIKIIWRNSKK